MYQISLAKLSPQEPVGVFSSIAFAVVMLVDTSPLGIGTISMASIQTSLIGGAYALIPNSISVGELPTSNTLIKIVSPIVRPCRSFISGEFPISSLTQVRESKLIHVPV